MKAGIKTTEFWLTVAANVVGALLASGQFTEGTTAKLIGVAAMVLTTMGYTVSRGAAKKGAGQ